MKKLFLFELGYYLCLHVLGPLMYYQLRGEYVNIYTYCPAEYMNKAALIIGVPIVISMVLVLLLPIGRKNIMPSVDKRTTIYFYVGCLFIFAQQLTAGSYINLGNLNGTLLAYMGFFFDLGVLLTLFYILGTEEINLFLMGIAYLVTTLAASSRQGALIIVVAILAMLVATRKYYKFRKRIYIMVLCICLASPFAYMFATAQRGGSSAGTGTELIDNIVGRCSNLEVLGIALYQKDNEMWIEDVFDEKYSIENQVKQCINSLIVGDVFEADVNPNQYYRTIFLGVPEQQSKETYTSINLTFSGYLYLKYPLIISWVITIVTLMFLYAIATTCKWPQMFSVIMLVFVTSSILDYFDWVMIMNTILRYVIVAGVFWCLNNVINAYVPRLVMTKTKLRFTK